MTYDEFRLNQIVEDIQQQRNGHAGLATHRRVLHTLEASKLWHLANLYWQQHCLTPENLDEPIGQYHAVPTR